MFESRIGSCLAAALALVALLLVAPARAQTIQTDAAQAILMDYASGTVLFEKNADELMVPASMAKIMTVEVILHEIREGRLSMDQEFTVSENAWRKGGGPSGGSSMFAQLNSRIKLSDLLHGIIIQSGNDACIVAAEGIAGTEENFAQMMTKRARELGLTKSTFRNATGYYDPDQRVTARELARLTHHLIETYPEEYKIFGQEEFTWNKIRQRNRNPLLAMNMGADGVKTGFLDEAGYGLVASAVQNGQRLILVVNGLKSIRDRSNESRKILEWGFRAFESRQLFTAGETIGEAKVYGGASGSVSLVSRTPVNLLMPRGGGNERLSARIVYNGPLRPPVARGTQVGRLKVTRGDVQALDMPLYAGEDVEEGTMTQRAVDALLELGSGAVRDAVSAAFKR